MEPEPNNEFPLIVFKPLELSPADMLIFPMFIDEAEIDVFEIIEFAVNVLGNATDWS